MYTQSQTLSSISAQLNRSLGNFWQQESCFFTTFVTEKCFLDTVDSKVIFNSSATHIVLPMITGYDI